MDVTSAPAWIGRGWTGKNENGAELPMKSTASLSDRIDYLDSAKGIFIIFIIMGHHLLGVDPFKRYLYSMGVTPFFLISGFLYAHRKEWEQPFRQNCIRKIQKFLYPYVTFSVINLLWNILYYKVVYPDVAPDIGFPKMILFTVSTYGYHSMWYLPCVLWGTLLFFALRRSRHHGLLWAALAVGTVVFYILFDKSLTGLGIISYIYSYLFRIAVAVVFLYAGSVLYGVFQALDRRRETLLLLLCLAFSAVIAVLYQLFPDHFPVANLAAHRLGNPYVYYLASVSNTTVIVLLCKWFLGKSRVLAYFGRNSLIVMALHMDATVNVAWWIVPKLSIGLGETINSVMVVALQIVMFPVIIAVLNRYFPFILRYPRRKQHDKM